MNIRLLPALLLLTAAASARAATVTTRQDFDHLRGVNIQVGFHDVQLTTVTGQRAQLTITTEAIGPGADAFVKRVQPLARFDSGTLTVRSPEGSVAWPPLLKVRARVQLSLPAGAALNVVTGSGDVQLSGAARTVPTSLRTGSGDVMVRAALGDLNVTTGSGDVRLESPVARLGARLGSGDLLSLADVASATVAAASGQVTLQALSGPLDLQANSGDVTAVWRTAPRGTVRVRADSGDIALTFPAGTVLGGQVVSRSGNLSSDFGQPLDDDGAGARVRLGGAGPQLDVSSGSGDIQLRRR